MSRRNRTQLFFLQKSNVGVALRRRTCVEPLTETNQSASNVPPQHLGPFLNCKFCWHGLEELAAVPELSIPLEEVPARARGSRWGPRLWAAVSCKPAWSMLRPVTSQLPPCAEGQGRGEARWSQDCFSLSIRRRSKAFGRRVTISRLSARLGSLNPCWNVSLNLHVWRINALISGAWWSEVRREGLAEPLSETWNYSISPIWKPWNGSVETVALSDAAHSLADFWPSCCLIC